MNHFKILLVDDVETNIYTLKLIIEENFENVEIFEALSVKEAIEQIMKHNFDLILTDIQMPEASGFDLAKYLSEIEETKNIPIIMITGIYDDVDNKKMAYNSSQSVVDFINKPIDSELFCSKLKVFINIFNSMKKDKKIIAKQEQELQNSKVNTMLENIEDNFDGNIKIDTKEIDMFLDSINEFIEEIEGMVDYNEIEENKT